jgi:hypothetical protein
VFFDLPRRDPEDERPAAIPTPRTQYFRFRKNTVRYQTFQTAVRKFSGDCQNDDCWKVTAYQTQAKQAKSSNQLPVLCLVICAISRFVAQLVNIGWSD